MAPFRHVEGNQAGPNALGILLPPGRRTLVVVRPRSLAWDLIPLNPTPGSKWTASEPGVAAQFEARLAERGIAVTVRDTRGREIDGACGQLAAAEV